MAIRLGSNKFAYKETPLKSEDLNDTFEAVDASTVEVIDQTSNRIAGTEYTQSTYKWMIVVVSVSVPESSVTRKAYIGQTTANMVVCEATISIDNATLTSGVIPMIFVVPYGYKYKCDGTIVRWIEYGIGK